MFALTELCPAIVEFVDKLENLGKSSDYPQVTFTKATPNWDNLKKMLESEANQCFTAWVDHLVLSFKASLNYFLTDNASLNILAKWDTSEIAEEAESGEKVAGPPFFFFITLSSKLD